MRIQCGDIVLRHAEIFDAAQLTTWWNDGEVTMISIGGDAKFGSSDYFDPCTPVVISYH